MGSAGRYVPLEFGSTLIGLMPAAGLPSYTKAHSMNTITPFETKPAAKDRLGKPPLHGTRRVLPRQSSGDHVDVEAIGASWKVQRVVSAKLLGGLWDLVTTCNWALNPTYAGGNRYKAS